MYFFLIFAIVFGCIDIYILTSMNPFSQEKYAISVYHFNSQFVPSIDDFLGVERNIINESIREILNMYHRHPNWKFNIELSGICLKAMYDNYTDVFNVLKLLVDRDQCELILSPYSETLSIAFTYIDMIKSLELSHEVAMSCNITFSKVLFLQENQFHTAFPLLKKMGYEIYCVSGDTLRYYNINNMAPVMEYTYLGETVDLMVTTFATSVFPYVYNGGVLHVFRWYGDGEASNTNSGFGNADPEEFKLESERMELHEARGNMLELMGFHFVKVSEWVGIAKSKGLSSILSPTVPDSTWNTYDSKGAFQWMGLNTIKPDRLENENDGYIRSDNYRVRNRLLATESLFNYYNNTFNSSFREKIKGDIKKAWKHLILAEVSDSTGWTPRKEEWEYSLYHDQQALTIINSTIKDIKKVVNLTSVQIHVENNTIINNSANFKNITRTLISPNNLPIPIEINGTDYSMIAYNNTWMNYSFYSVKIDLNASDYYKIFFQIEKPINNITFSTSLAENTTLTLYKSNYNSHNLIFLPLTNGLIYSNGIGIIRNNSRHYVAMCWKIDTDSIFQYEITQENNISVEFFILKDNINTCLNLANIINTYPVMIL